jgi:ubiquinone/menaquinone biosynthesis C-methylase UbiE
LQLNNSNPIDKILGGTDIYLIDQIMKGRYNQQDIILDAGCGYGRNLHYFLQNDFVIFGTDQDANAISTLQTQHPALASRFRHASVEKLPFENNYFSHIISSAVLHFAKGTLHFHYMIAEMARVVQPGGSIFIRMTSDIGIEDKVLPVEDGVYTIPDGSTRFLLTRPLLADMLHRNRLLFLEPLKTVNVEDVRCMSTLVLTKLGSFNKFPDTA